MEGYNSNRNVVHLCRYHVVWCPKYRRSVLKPPIVGTLKKILQTVAHDTRSKIIEMESCRTTFMASSNAILSLASIVSSSA